MEKKLTKDEKCNMLLNQLCTHASGIFDIAREKYGEDACVVVTLDSGLEEDEERGAGTLIVAHMNTVEDAKTQSNKTLKEFMQDCKKDNSLPIVIRAGEHIFAGSVAPGPEGFPITSPGGSA